ncbi:MAG: hypothetical protein WEC33_00580, partial [Dehalococcoidia bacterium]
DKPYDQFVREQLAGDALGADAATGFIVGGAYDLVKSPDPVLTANQRADELFASASVNGDGGRIVAVAGECGRCEEADNGNEKQGAAHEPLQSVLR